MSEIVTIDDLSFVVRRSDRRTTLGMTIERDGKLILTAPTNSSLELVKRFAREKQFWVYTKLAQKEMLFRPRTPKEFVAGEGFYYLGRSYRLKIIPADEVEHNAPPLRLHQGRYVLRREEQYRAAQHFTAWYKRHAQMWISRRAELLANRLEVEAPAVLIRDLGFRWGSCSPSGKVNIHWRAILLPPRIIEYIVAHELVHLNISTHRPEFWARLKRAMPDFEERKEWLAVNGNNC
jgi:predicted metal-dependent hydrolase